MNENLQLLYDTVKAQGLYTKSFDEFVAKYNGNPNEQENIFKEVAARGLYSKTRQDFKAKYFPVVQPQEEAAPVKKKEEPTDSLLESGLSGRSALTIEDIDATPEQVAVERTAEAERLATPLRETGARDESQYFDPSGMGVREAGPEADKYFADAEAKAAELAAEVEKDRLRTASKDEEMRAKGLYEPAEALANSLITPELIAQEEEDVVPILRENFGVWGFNFIESGAGDAVTVVNHDGTQEETFDLDTFTARGAESESVKLRNFIKNNAYASAVTLPGTLGEDGVIGESRTLPYEEADGIMAANELRGNSDGLYYTDNEPGLNAQNSLKAKESRPISRRNADGTSSSHLMTSFEEDGVYKVVPTLFPKAGYRTDGNANTWDELPLEEAIERARQRGEVYTFNTEEEANAFAEGSWKTANTVDLESELFFQKRGGDFNSYQQALATYDDLVKKSLLLEEMAENNIYRDDLTSQEIRLLQGGTAAGYRDYFNEDGSPLNMRALNLEKSRVEQEAQGLFDIVYDEDLKLMREELDVYLEEKRQVKAQEASKANQQLKGQLAALEQQSFDTLGVPFSELPDFTPRTQNEANAYNEIVENYLGMEASRQAAALQYQQSKLYLDRKHDKNIGGEFVDNVEAFEVEWSNGIKTGEGAEVLLKLATGSIDVEDDEALMDAVVEMIQINESKSLNQSRGLSRFNNARTGPEIRRALRDNPAEVALTFMGSSLAQVLPYGAEILAGTTLSGTAIGAGVGASAFGVGALPGAVTGFGYGVRTGMSVNSFILEYTNALLEAAGSFGYDATDPEQMFLALRDEKVWAEGKERGFKRGITIAAMDFIAGGMAGKVFKPALAASKGAKVASYTLERFIFDPAAEGAGEALAMLSVGDEIDGKEVLAESLGSIGSQGANAAATIARQTMGNNNLRIANEFMNTETMALDGSSDTQIQRWTDNMVRLGKIDAEQGQRILENVGLRREANDLLDVSSSNSGKARVRLMELMAVRDGLSSTNSRKEVFQGTIADINAEIRTISETGDVVEGAIDISSLNIAGYGRKGVPSYRVGKTMMTKKQFLSYIEDASPRRLRRIADNAQITNDSQTASLVEGLLSEVSEGVDVTDAVNTGIEVGDVSSGGDAEAFNVTPTIDTEDAIQEPSTETVLTQEPTTDSAEVGEGVPATDEATEQTQAEDQAAEEIAQEEVVEAIDKPIRSDVNAFRNGTIDPVRLNGIVAGIEKRKADGKKLTKFQKEVVASEEAAVNAEAEALSQEIGEGLFAPEPVAEESAPVEEATPVAEEAAVEDAAPTDDELTLMANRYEREGEEARGRFKRERAKVKRRNDSPAKTAALAALDVQEAAEVEAIRAQRGIVIAARSVRQGKGLPKFARPDGRFPATEEQLRQINELAGVEAAPVEAASVEEAAPAVEAAPEEGGSVGFREFNRGRIKLEEKGYTWPAVRDIVSQAISSLDMGRAGDVRKLVNSFKKLNADALIPRAADLSSGASVGMAILDSQDNLSNDIYRSLARGEVSLEEFKAFAKKFNVALPEAAPAVEAAPVEAAPEVGVETPVVEAAPEVEVEQTIPEIEAELLSRDQEGTTVEEITAEEFPMQESNFDSQEAYGRAITQWSANKARRLAAAQERQTQVSPEERRAEERQRMMAPVNAGKFFAYGTRNGLESFTEGEQANLNLDRERPRENYREDFVEKTVDGKYYYIMYEGGEGVIKDRDGRPGYVASAFESVTKLNPSQKAIVKDALIERVKIVRRKADPDSKTMPADYSTTSAFSKFDTSTQKNFQIEKDTNGFGVTDKEVREATKLLNEVSPELAENDFTVEETTMVSVPIVVTENGELVSKVRRIPLSELYDMSVNLAMADQLKVDEFRMGGPFFALQEGIFGKVAWASIDEEAAKRIIIGASKGDYTVVYNMKPSALDSNMVTARYAMDLISQQENSQELFEQAKEYLKGRKYGTKPADNKKAQAAIESATIEEFLINIDKLGTDLRADIITNLFPTDQVQSKVDIHVKLKEIGATMESIRAANIEQFTEGLPMGALTMVLEVRDAQGRKVTPELLGPNNENWRDFMMTEEQQQAEDVPSHTNYPIYIRGTAVGLLEDTVPFWNVLPSSLEKINQKVTQRITKRDKYTVLDDKGRTLDVRVVTNTDGTQTVDIYNKAGQAIASKSRVTDVKNIRRFITNNYGTIKAFKEGKAATSKEARAAEMRSAMMTAGTSSRVAPSTKTNYEQFLSRLSASFPGVEVVTDEAEFKALIKDAYSNKLTTKDQKVYGVVSEGKVYLNPSLENYNTPIHEFGHIWLNTAKALNSEAYQVGMDLVPDDSPYVQQVKDSKNYQRVIKQMKKDGSSPQEINTYIREEALALAIGNKGESFTKAAEKRNFKNWLTDLFNFIKELTGISDLSSEQLQNLTLDEFAQAVVVDLLSQNELFAEAQEVGLSEDMQFMTGTDNGSMSMNDTIAFGRQNGYADAAIRKLLMDRGYTAEAIDASMSEVINLFSPTVPVEFGNVDGGMNVGKDIYADVYNQVEDFANSSANPSFSKVRAKALELLRANPVFQSQSVEVQEQLTVALDKSMNIKANRDISQEISAIRNNIKQRRKGAQTLIQSKRVLSKFIRDNMPKSGIYSQGQINRLVNRVAKATESSLLADMEYVLGQVEIQNKKIKNKLIGKLASEVKSDAKKGKSSSSGKKARRGRLGADAQAFAAELTKVLSAATIADPVKRQAALDEIRVSLETEEAVKAIEKNSLQGFDNLTTKERRIVLKSMAFQEFQGINDMSLEQVKEIFKEYKDGQLAERTILAQTRATRAEANAKINQGITAQLKQLFPSFFNLDGQPLNKNEFNAKLKEARKIWRSGKGKGFNERGKNMILASKAYVKAFTSSNVGDVIKSSVRGVLHLGTFMETLGPEMKREVYSRLNRAESRYLKGYYNQIDSMDAMAQKYGFESYKLMRREIYSADELTLDNITRIRGKQDKNSNLATREENFTKDAVMRIYALSKNPVQRDKLARMGIDFDDPITAAKIENFLGQEMMSFVDETVNYLSNDYYEGINNVYREVNDVNLNYISNYFPTQTIANGTDVNLLEGGDFMGIFDAEFANALKERVDTDNEIILDNAAFTTALEDHFQSMERFKAFAADTRTLNSIMTNEAVKTALDMTGTSNLVRQSINQAINPNSGKNAIYNDRALSLLSSVFVGIALGWKAVQIVKQATSAVLAIPDYTFRKDGKRMPGADLLLWLGDFAIVLAQGRKYVKFAKENSPSFRHRLEQGVKGDIVGLETGTKSTPTIRKKGILGSLMRFNERGSAFGTMVGDIAGVLGYMANYRRNVINGMDTETAIEKFEEYNSSQQSRNPADRSVMMQNQSAYTALLTMFGTAPMLMINNVVQSGMNIGRDVGKRKAPKLKDLRKFYMNFAGANVLFTAAGNFGKLWAGDDEDREEVYKKLLLASAGFNLLSFIPILGSAAEGVASWMMGDGFRLGEQGVTPVKGLIRNFKDVETGKDGALAAVKTGLSVAVRGDVNNFIGLFEFTESMIEGTDEDILAMESFYEAMGIGGSSRPNYIEDGILSTQGQREKDKKDAKKKKKEEKDARRANPASKRKEELKKERENKKKYDRLPSE